MMFLTATVQLLSLISCIRAAVISRPHETHDLAHENYAYETAWFQPLDHPVHSLFKRAVVDDGSSYVPVGSPAWSSAFPNPGPLGVTPNPSLTPPEWIAALNAAVAAGKIPNIPTSPYPVGVDPGGPQVCSATAGCQIPGDIWNGPDGIFSSSFDDGPWQPQTTTLLQFLTSQNLTSTHFMIGQNIIRYPTQFLQVFNASHDIGCHTWSHPFMTNKTNEDIIAELGWTMQLIHNSTGGRLPRYWRPPYGDSDWRVRSIALEVFGLQTVIWNHDSQDWTSTQAGQVTASIQQIVSTSPKSPGLIILEHEISDPDVDGFIAAFPSIAGNGWTFKSLVQVINNGTTYQNVDSSGEVIEKGVLLTSPSSTSSSIASTTTSSTASLPSATQKKSSSSSSLLSHKSPCSRLFLILSAVAILLSV